jgi:hypothetical protein
MRPGFGEILERIGYGDDGTPAGGATRCGAIAMGAERRYFLGGLPAYARLGGIV